MKKALSMMLVVAMVASMSTGAFALNGTGKIGGEGENKVDEAIYNYQIPIKLDFAIDPFMKGEAGTQVFSGTYPIINKSDVPLSVRVSAKVTPGTGVTINLKDSADKVSQAAGYTGKDLYVEAVAAKAVAADTIAVATANTVVEPIITKGATTTGAVFTNGTATSEATLKVTLDGISINNNAGSSGKTAATFVAASIKDSDGNSVGQLGSIETAAAAENVVSTFATASDTKNKTLFDGAEATFFIRGNEIKMKIATSGGLTTAGVVTFTALDKTIYKDKIEAGTPNIATTINLPTTVVLDTGSPAEVKIKTGATDLIYPTIKSGTATAGAKMTLGTAEKDRLWFVLNEADYINAYADNGSVKSKAKFFNGLNKTEPATGLSGFRFIGAATPGADWKAEDIKINATFEVAGVPTEAVKGLTPLSTTEAQRVFVIPASASFGKSVADFAKIYPATANTTEILELTYDMGSKMKKISKIEFRPAGALKAAAYTVMPVANYEMKADGETIVLKNPQLKLLKDPASGVPAKGGFAAGAFKEDTMSADNIMKIYFDDNDATTTKDDVVEIVIPIKSATV